MKRLNLGTKQELLVSDLACLLLADERDPIHKRAGVSQFDPFRTWA